MVGSSVVKDWYELTKMTQGARLTIQKVRLADEDITIEGEFDLPPLANLSTDDQVFVAAFIRSHGSIKQMEQLFGVSYPTIKNRLNRIGEQLSFVDVAPVPPADDVLRRLDRGEISVDEALDILKGQ
ncbi:MAG TPA: DUF2089 domain-containing protein [Armatimonadota bacterium]|nr:DUF2089 domain-containing protein [Armatimonadota bacterium]HPP73574.1 DUF2089 domain-containing protein [Armatimonadota bacterium]